MNRVNLALKLSCIGLMLILAVSLHSQDNPTENEAATSNEIPYSISFDDQYNITQNKLKHLARNIRTNINLLEKKYSETIDEEVKDQTKDEIKRLRKNQNQLESDIASLKLMYMRKKSEKRIIRSLVTIEKKHFGSSDINPEAIEETIFVEEEKEEKEEQTASNTQAEVQIQETVVQAKPQSIDIDQIQYIPPPPAAYPCVIEYDGFDPNSLQKRIQFKPETIFFYTNPKLKELYKEYAYVTGDCYLAKVGEEDYIVLSIAIRSKEAIKNYGIIQGNSKLKITLINGDEMYMSSANTSQGVLDAISGITKYTVFYPLGKNDKRELSKYEVDQMGIMWTSGFESYEVFNIDVIKNQINCLEKL